MIRIAEERDIPRIVEMGRAFHEASAYRDFGFDEKTFGNCARKLMQDFTGILLVDGQTPQGMIGGIAYPMYFNARHWAAQELFWWVEPAHRGRGKALLKAFEDWARGCGAHSIQMIALDAMKPVDNLYLRAGYSPAERYYIRSL